MKVEESLNVTFDESPPPTKLSPLVNDDVGEEEAFRTNTKIVNINTKDDESIEVDEVVNIKDSKNHPLDQVIGNLNQRTLRSQAQNHSEITTQIDYQRTKEYLPRVHHTRQMDEGPMPFAMLLTRLHNHILNTNPQAIVPIARFAFHEHVMDPLDISRNPNKEKGKSIASPSVISSSSSSSELSASEDLTKA
ncbi:hypothetical protein Tco_0503375 [Tanacetum coccineum]